MARFSLAVDRPGKKDGKQEADFPSCVAFGKRAEFCEKYLSKGMKIIAVGRLQTGSYTNRDGVKIYTTDVITDEIEFAESKKAQEANGTPAKPTADKEGFMQIPDADEDLPFNF